MMINIDYDKENKKRTNIRGGGKNDNGRTEEKDINRR